jgi:hypothetical protein|uniref:LapA family protein n=1 Tax=candidate division WOR-3 bacterium TaxID=2052148 RepID=A0A7V3KM89_UNCW3
MKTIKVIFWLIVIGFLGLAVYQNRQTLNIDLPFSLDVYFRPEVRWSYTVGHIMGFSAFVGFLVGSWIFFRLYWRKRRELKQCMDSLREMSIASSSESSLGDKTETKDEAFTQSNGS